MVHNCHFESSLGDGDNGMDPFDLEDLNISGESHRPFTTSRGRTQKDTAFPYSSHFMMNLRIALDRTLHGTGTCNNAYTGLRRRSIKKLLFYALIVCLCTMSVCTATLSSLFGPSAFR